MLRSQLRRVLFAPAALSFLAACDVGVGDSSLPLPIPGVEGEGGFGVGGASSNGGGGTTSNGGGGGGTTSTGGGTSVGGGGQGACDGGGPVIETNGSNTKYLLKGTLLLPTGAMPGEVLIVGTTIQCVGATCSGDPQASGATVVQTNGVISPGLIDGHNHILFDIFDEDDWSPTQTYTNHNQWPNDAKYGAMVDAKQYLNGESGSPVKLSCELDKYGELKELIAGTTSVQGSPGGADRACYGSLTRSLGGTHADLPEDKMQTSTLFPSQSSGDGVCNNFTSGKTNAYVVHVSEGIDTSARNEFDKLGTITTVDNCLYNPKTTVIHGVALNTAQIDTFAANNMQLVWSPQSNIFLYGANTDFTATANIPYYLQKGVNVSLGPDWSIGGSQNMLDEIRFADLVDNTEWGDILTPKQLWEMATVNSAAAMGVTQYLGSLTVGKRADIAVFLPQSGSDPYEAVLEATPTQVTMVFVDGRLLYGDADLQGQGPPSSVCETVDICCRSKFLCIGETNGAANDRMDQTFAEFRDILESAMEAYDDLDLTQWNFAPITPIVKCQ